MGRRVDPDQEVWNFLDGVPGEPDKPSEAMGMRWGDKGCVHDPSRCQHTPEEGCMWCCMRCNTDTHFCRGCGTVVGHREVTCPDCRR